MDSKSDSKLRKLLLVEAMETRLKRLLLSIEEEGLRVIREKEKFRTAESVVEKMKKEIDEISEIYKILESSERDMFGMDHRERQWKQQNEDNYVENFKVID